MTSRILVTSAAGKTGQCVALQLAEQGHPVRAFVRRMDGRAERMAEAGVEIFVGNQYDITDMRAAMQGVRRAYQCAPTAPNGLYFNAVFSIAAHEAKLEHVVTLGQWLTAARHPSQFTREVYLSDALARISPHMTVTSVDPGWFADNYTMVLEAAAHLGMFTMPLGPGDEKKNAPPSNEDIARVVVAALVDPQTHAGKFYRPTGPKLMSPNDIAAAMGRVLGRKVTYADVSEKMMTKALRANPPANYSEAAVTQLAIYTHEYRKGSFAVNAPTDDVRTVGGRDPEDFDTILRRYVVDRPDLKPGLARRARAVLGLFRMMMTPALDLAKARAARDYVQISEPLFCQDDADWRATHVPQSTTSGVHLKLA